MGMRLEGEEGMQSKQILKLTPDGYQLDKRSRPTANIYPNNLCGRTTISHKLIVISIGQVIFAVMGWKLFEFFFKAVIHKILGILLRMGECPGICELLLIGPISLYVVNIRTIRNDYMRSN